MQPLGAAQSQLREMRSEIHHRGSSNAPKVLSPRGCKRPRSAQLSQLSAGDSWADQGRKDVCAR
eukprot:13596424-Alexandrium_andersonii.AAC.1